MLWSKPPKAIQRLQEWNSQVVDPIAKGAGVEVTEEGGQYRVEAEP
jgi:hypothetical protein